MTYQAFLIKYSEIGVKGKNRYLFEDALVRQIKRALYGVDGNFIVKKQSGRIFISVEGEYDFERAVYLIKRNTRHFAKGQLTWFKRERDVIWINKQEFGRDDEKILKEMIRIYEQ